MNDQCQQPLQHFEEMDTGKSKETTNELLTLSQEGRWLLVFLSCNGKLFSFQMQWPKSRTLIWIATEVFFLKHYYFGGKKNKNLQQEQTYSSWPWCRPSGLKLVTAFFLVLSVAMFWEKEKKKTFFSLIWFKYFCSHSTHKDCSFFFWVFFFPSRVLTLFSSRAPTFFRAKQGSFFRLLLTAEGVVLFCPCR